VLGECENSIQPCDENQQCDEVNHECLESDDPDDEMEEDFISSECSYLGDDAQGRPDRDAYVIQGTAGESVEIDLEGAEDGNGGEVKFIIGARHPETREKYKVRQFGQLPMHISATLPWDGEFRILVKERPGTQRHPKTPYHGDYCLIIESSDGAASSLEPAHNVESDQAD
jgi:hypothetical protein